MKVFDDIMDAVAAVRSGQLEAVITAYPTAVQITKKNPDFRYIKDALSHEDTAIALKKGNGTLLQQLNAIITDLKNDGTLDDMKKRWLKDDMSPYQEPAIQVPTTGEVLRVGVSATREPMTFVDRDGRISGHDGELARLIAVRLHRPIEFYNMKFMALIPALASGKIDVIITGMSATEERRKSVDFTIPYFANGQVMLVQGAAHDNGGPKPLATLNDLKDKRIGVLQGSIHDIFANRAYPQATIQQFKSPSDMLLAVVSGKVDAAIYSSDELLQMFRSHNELAILGPSLLPTQLALGFNLKDSKLREQFNQFLSELRASGTYDDMIRRWMKNGETRMPHLDTAPVHGDLAVGLVSDNGLPFTAVQDGQLVGFNIELLNRFGAKIGKRVKFVDMEFGSLIAATAARKIDMIGAVLSVTEERKKQIAFSDPYYEQGAYAFALKRNLAAYAADGQLHPKSGVPAFIRSIEDSFRNNIIQDKRYLLILDGLETTLLLSVLSTLFGTLLGAFVCFMRMSPRAILNMPARLYIDILRGTPVLVLLMIVFYVIFGSINISPVFVAVIAFGMNFGAYVSEIFRSGIEGIDIGQREAGIAMGFTVPKTFLYIILPQMVRRILPVYKGEFISLVKMTSIVGYIAVQDLTKASDIIRSRTFDAFFPLVMIAILYFAIAWVFLQLLQLIERATIGTSRTRTGARP